MILIPYIFLGGGIGAVFRYLISLPIRPLGLRPWMGTLVANLLGCFIFFLFHRYFIHSSNKTFSTFLLTGMMGGLTTFSTFSFEVVSVLKAGRVTEAVLILALNLVIALSFGLYILRGDV